MCCKMLQPCKPKKGNLSALKLKKLGYHKGAVFRIFCPTNFVKDCSVCSHITCRKLFSKYFYPSLNENIEKSITSLSSTKATNK